MKAHWTVPNILTVARIGLALLAAWLAYASASVATAVVLLTIAALLDGFDGWYARAFAQATSLGKHLDPFADKILVAVVLIWIGADAHSQPVWWMVGIALAREVAMTGLRSYSARCRRRLIPASPLGRWKMFLQSSAGLTILWVTHILNRDVPVGVVMVALAAMLVVSFAAMIGYLKAKGPAADHEQTTFALRLPG